MSIPVLSGVSNVSLVDFPILLTSLYKDIYIKHDLDTDEFIIFSDSKEIKRIPTEDVESFSNHAEETPSIELKKQESRIEDFNEDYFSYKKEEIQSIAVVRQEEVNKEFDKQQQQKKTWRETCSIM